MSPPRSHGTFRDSLDNADWMRHCCSPRSRSCPWNSRRRPSIRITGPRRRTGSLLATRTIGRRWRSRSSLGCRCGRRTRTSPTQASMCSRPATYWTRYETPDSSNRLSNCSASASPTIIKRSADAWLLLSKRATFISSGRTPSCPRVRPASRRPADKPARPHTVANQKSSNDSSAAASRSFRQRGFAGGVCRSIRGGSMSGSVGVEVRCRCHVDLAVDQVVVFKVA